jgi:uncharacterized membrane protein YidH (DUF202 family)
MLDLGLEGSCMERAEHTSHFRAQAASESRSVITASTNAAASGDRSIRAWDRTYIALFTLACFTGLTALFFSVLSFVPGMSAFLLSRITMVLLLCTFAFLMLGAHAMDKADAIRRRQKIKQYLK